MAIFSIPDYPTVRNKTTKRLQDFFRPIAKRTGTPPVEMHHLIWLGIVQNIEARIPVQDQFDSHIFCTGLDVTSTSFQVEMTVRTHGQYQIGTFLFVLDQGLTNEWRSVADMPNPEPLFVMYAPEPAPVKDIDFGPPVRTK